MKRIFSIILVLVMLASFAACNNQKTTTTTGTTTTTATTPTQTNPPDEPPVEGDGPRAGDVVEGFICKQVSEFPLVGAVIYYFEHERTGARLMYIANNATDRVFDLTFFTRAIDNTGLPHVFEHSTLDGSAKYPSKSLFFNLSYQTYNTYMNAMTMALLTTYPVSSLSEAQLLKYADYYTDSCFNPTIMENESIFREEAWRYRLENAEDDLTVEGTVYSEMKGARGLTSSAYTNTLRAAFPGSTIGNVSGGEPESIVDMTWQGLKDYHNKYYHPSNCIAYLYGQFEDYTAFLKLLNEAFEPYDKREFTFEDDGYTPITAPVEVSNAFPVESGSSTDKASCALYGFVCPGLKDDPDSEMLLNTLTDLLIEDGSPLMTSLKRAIPSGNFSCFIELDGPEDMVTFFAQNIDPEEAQIFKNTVNDALKEVAANGFDKDFVESVMSSLSLSIRLMGEETQVGVDLISSIASSYAATGDPYNYMKYVETLDNLEKWNDQGLYAKVVSEWLINNQTNVLSVTYPEPGLREQLDAAENARLAEVKASMSEEEINEIIAMTNAPDEEDDSSEYVAALRAVTVESLPEEISRYEVSSETKDDGVKYVNAVAGVEGVGRTAMFLDASGIEEDDIHWFALYTALLGEMDTENYTRDELAVQTTKYLYDWSVRLSIFNDDSDRDYSPKLRFGWTSTDENLEKGYELIYEILYKTDFSDTEQLLGLVQKYKSSLKSSITNSPYNTMIYRAFGYYSSLYNYYSYYTGIDYYTFLVDTEKLIKDNPDSAVSRLKKIQAYFHNRMNAAAIYAGSEEGIKINAPLAEAFMAKLDQKKITPKNYYLPIPAKNEALIIDSNVQYNGIVAGYDQLGMTGYTADLDAVSALLGDDYLYPQLRDQYGAYGVMNGFTEDFGVYIVSYRDPNIKQTFTVYDALPEYFDTLETDQETIDGYILSSYAYYATPEGELSGAMSAAVDELIGADPEEKLDYMRELKSLTPEKLKEYAEAYRNLIQKGSRFTAGSASAINENADLYSRILNPFGSVDPTEVEFDDVPEGHEHYEAVRFVFENMIMDPKEDAHFGVDDDATVGDLAGALYALIGGDQAAQQEAIDFFADYGITTSMQKADDPIDGVTANRILASFSTAAGVPYENDPNPSHDVLTRGELSEILMVYVLPLMEE